jgi:hypothetical protein
MKKRIVLQDKKGISEIRVRSVPEELKYMKASGQVCYIWIYIIKKDSGR